MSLSSFIIWQAVRSAFFLPVFYRLHSFVVIAQSSSSSAHHCPSPYIFVTLRRSLLLAQFHIVFPSSSSLLLLLSSFPPPLLSFSSVSLCVCSLRSFLSLYKWWRCVFIESDRVKSCIKVTVASSMTAILLIALTLSRRHTQTHIFYPWTLYCTSGLLIEGVRYGYLLFCCLTHKNTVTVRVFTQKWKSWEKKTKLERFLNFYFSRKKGLKQKQKVKLCKKDI